MSVTDYRVHGATAVITMASPPVNGLGLPLRKGIIEGLDRAAADEAVRVIVLIGAEGKGGRTFSGGADIREFNTPLVDASPDLHQIIAALEASQKPVVAAIGGACMGGGLELALGCHYRVGASGAQIALPEVKLGILPGAGGTQRLPRVLGVETALNMIVTGQPVPSDMLRDTPLFDAFTDGDLLEAALALATRIVDEKLPLKRVRDLPAKHPDADAYFGFARGGVQAMAGPFPAPMKCLEAVQAAVKSRDFDAGIKVERDGFRYLVGTPESRALRHAFFGDRATSKIPDVPSDTPVRPIAKAAVIGAGTMGGGIAMNFLNAGIPVIMLEMKQEALDRGVATIRGNYERSAKRGKLTQEKLEQRMALLSTTLDYAGIGDADIVVEAVFEDIDVKRQVFEKLDQVMKPGAILASNTSTLDVDRIAAFTKRPQDVIGTHFFSPANVMRLLEVVRGRETAKDVLATVMKLAKTLRKLPVVSGVCDGFIGNRMINKYSAEAHALLMEGALPAQVDGALERWGMAMGPFRMGDLAGNDVGWFIRKRHYQEHPDWPQQLIADAVCEAGRYGQKTGKGWYLYKPGDRKAYPDPEVEAMVDAARREAGVTPRKISDAEIIERLVYALANEGARLLEEGIALRASDIDMAYLNGYGFPAHRGGPMLYADEQGLWQVARRMRAFEGGRFSEPGFWTPAPLLARLAEENKTFNGN